MFEGKISVDSSGGKNFLKLPLECRNEVRDKYIDRQAAAHRCYTSREAVHHGKAILNIWLRNIYLEG